jgi:hypothetical protein
MYNWYHYDVVGLLYKMLMKGSSSVLSAHEQMDRCRHRRCCRLVHVRLLRLRLRRRRRRRRHRYIRVHLHCQRVDNVKVSTNDRACRRTMDDLRSLNDERNQRIARVSLSFIG